MRRKVISYIMSICLIVSFLILFTGCGDEVVRYSISFDTNGGTSIEDAMYESAEMTIKPTDPTKAGYEFLGWWDNSDLSGDEHVFGEMLEINITLYAKWKLAIYTITYSLLGGEWPSGANHPTRYTINDTFTVTNPIRDGFTFGGWVGGGIEVCTKPLVVSQMSGDKEFMAIWTIND